MEYRGEDLPRYGVRAAILSQIQRTSERYSPVAQSRRPTDPAIIVLNQSQSAIAALAWTWKFEPETGCSRGVSVSTAGGATSLLEPFGLDERQRKLYAYWNVILPGSKRLIRGTRMLGDNTDVRPPEPDEVWPHSGFIGTSGSDGAPVGLKSVALILDSVFFVDGGFAGPDALGTFELVTAEVDAHVQVAKVARGGHDRGLTPAEIFARIKRVTRSERRFTPPRPPGPAGTKDLSAVGLRKLASQIALMRQHGSGEDQVIGLLMSWADTPLPNYRRL